jgi:hypothetical protein
MKVFDKNTIFEHNRTKYHKLQNSHYIHDILTGGAYVECTDLGQGIWFVRELILITMLNKSQTVILLCNKYMSNLMRNKHATQRGNSRKIPENGILFLFYSP